MSFFVLSLSESLNGMWLLFDWEHICPLRSRTKHSCEFVCSMWGGYGEGGLKGMNSLCNYLVCSRYSLKLTFAWEVCANSKQGAIAYPLGSLTWVPSNSYLSDAGDHHGFLVPTKQYLKS